MLAAKTGHPRGTPASVCVRQRQPASRLSPQSASVSRLQPFIASDSIHSVCPQFAVLLPAAVQVPCKKNSVRAAVQDQKRCRHPLIAGPTIGPLQSLGICVGRSLPRHRSFLFLFLHRPMQERCRRPPHARRRLFCPPTFSSAERLRGSSA